MLDWAGKDRYNRYMLDIRQIRENPEAVRDSIKRRGIELDLDSLLDLDTQRREMITKSEEIQKQRNILASEVQGKPTEPQIVLGKELKTQHEVIAAEMDVVNSKYLELLSNVPNLIAEGTPDGGEENNTQLEAWGDKKTGGKDHLELNELHNLYDFEAGAKVAGNKFYFTRHKAVKLWQSIQMAVQEIIEQSGFELLGVPNLVNTEIAVGTGYLPKGEEQQNYIDSEQGLVMIATSEIPLTGFHKDEVLDLNIPKKYAALSPCYRLEAGAYGKHSKGLYRVHQFDKFEMYIFCQAEQSNQLLQEILNIEKQICQSLEIPYRVVRIAAGDLSAPAYEKYDVEYYSPVEGEYRELTSCSNCTDYQARNLNISYKDSDGNKQFAHTLNGTAVVSSRMPIAILENHQQADGSILLPKILHKYYGGDKL